MKRKQNFDGRQSKPSKQDDLESAREAQKDKRKRAQTGHLRDSRSLRRRMTKAVFFQGVQNFLLLCQISVRRLHALEEVKKMRARLSIIASGDYASCMPIIFGCD